MLRSPMFLRLFLAIFGLVAALVIVGVAMAHSWRESDVVGTQMVQLVIVLLAVAAAAVYLIVRGVVRPLIELGQATRAIAAGEYADRVPVRSDDELGALARSLNEISSDLGASLSQIREQGERQAAVLAGMTEGVVAVDVSERVLFANKAAGKLFGFVPPGVEGRPLLEVIRNHALHQAVAQVLSSRKSQVIEVEWQIDNPRVLAMQITSLPGKRGVGAVIVVHDNTELRRLETIRQEFIANVSHELKTPLSSIMAYTETLQCGAIDDRDNRDEFLRRIAEQGDRLNNLIQDMLSLARIETAQQQFEIIPVDLVQVIDRCLNDYTPQAAAKHIELAVDRQSPRLCVQADEEGLRVICGNLIDNAVKYTQEGGRVQLSWRAEGEFARLEVADNGPGIPRGDAARVFERFYRVDKARSRELGSTGLGLSIVKHLVQSFGGTVGVESQPGQGSRFWVELPLAS